MFNRTITRLFPISLTIHDGGAAAAGAGGGSGDGTGSSGNVPGVAAPGIKGENEPVVLYGKQDNPDAGDKNKQTAPAGNKQTEQPDRKAEFKQLMTDYKDEFSEYFQETFDKRFKDYKSQSEQLKALQPMFDTLAKRYGVDAKDAAKISESVDNDAMFLEELADEAGLTVDQYKYQRGLIRQNEARQQQDEARMAEERARGWIAEAETMSANYPGFDLQTEYDNNPKFKNLLKSGATVEAAYWATHFKELGAGVAQAAGKRAEANAVNNIQTKGRRPVEAGAAAQPGVVIRDDPSQFSFAELKVVAEKAKRGEPVKF